MTLLGHIISYLSSYPGYFREPQSIGLPEISWVTLQVCTSIFDWSHRSFAVLLMLHESSDLFPKYELSFHKNHSVFWSIRGISRNGRFYGTHGVNIRTNFKSSISCIIAHILYQLYHAFLCVLTLTCVYISVCAHIDGLPRSCVWPRMLSVYDLVCGCVCVLFIVFACFIYFTVGQ